MFFYFKIINCLIISLVPTHETVRTKHGIARTTHELTVPKGGSVCTNAWYEKYHAVKFPVPARGIFFILPTFFRVQRNKGNIKAV